MKILKIDGVDNRGDEQRAFGYVYFNDGVRVSYANMPEKTTGKPAWQVGKPGDGPWPDPERWHYERALAHLTEHGARMPDDAAA